MSFSVGLKNSRSAFSASGSIGEDAGDSGGEGNVSWGEDGDSVASSGCFKNSSLMLLLLYLLCYSFLMKLGLKLDVQVKLAGCCNCLLLETFLAAQLQRIAVKPPGYFQRNGDSLRGGVA